VTNWAGNIPKENALNVAGVPYGKASVDPKTGAVIRKRFGIRHCAGKKYKSH